MYQTADGSGQQQLSPWPPPSGGAERLVRESRWQRRRRPFTHLQIIFTRVTILVAGVGTPVVILIEPSSSLWWHGAVGGLCGLVISLASSSPYQLGQLLGLRPASPKQRG